MVKIDARSVKVIAWDLDGTILNSPRLMRVLVDELADKLSLQRPSDKVLAENFHGSLSDTLSAVLNLSNETDIERAIDAFLVNQERHYESIGEHLLDDAVALMERAKSHGLKQVIVTNREHEKRGAASPRAIVCQSPLKEHVDAVICGDDFTLFRKPDSRILEKTLTQWSVLPSEVVVIGDQFVDVQLAINLGTKAIIISRESDDLVNSHQLPDSWQDVTTIVRSLDDVTIG